MRTKVYRYVSVRFDETAQKVYFYRTNHKKLKARDLVIVPVGAERHPEVAEIVSVKDYTRDEVPYPPEKTKWVISKATPFRCLLAALGDAFRNAIPERDNQKERRQDTDDLAWIDEIEAWSAFFED